MFVVSFRTLLPDLSDFLKARIKLDGGQSYIVTCEVLDKMGFACHRVLHVLICRKCHICFNPNEAIGHARSCQSVPTKTIDMEVFRLFVSSQAIPPDVSSVILPSPRGPPVELIT